MGLINQTAQSYYNGNDYGNYQFVSLTDVINQFMLVYVGEDKIIPKAKRVDVAFHAQRALAELSFDTFKSCKAQEITVPASLQMTLPQDYVNYTKISWVDSAGIKHLLYPTSKTSNPYPVKQDANNNYEFNYNGQLMSETNLIANGDFDNDVGWTLDTAAWTIGNSSASLVIANITVFNHIFPNSLQATSGTAGYIEIDAPEIVEGQRYRITIDVVRPGVSTGELTLRDHTTNVSALNSPVGGSFADDVFLVNPNTQGTQSTEWIQGPNNTGKLKILKNADYDGIIDNIKVVKVSDGEMSDTWSSYKSGTPSENQDDYQDDTYWPMEGSRYGLDPQHAQANGSFYIDCVSGKIHFSSNISGKTVILDYISDSLGTDGEMQVHKFAEEAMYRWILHAIASGRVQTQQLVPRLKKEKFAAVRTAKLRLSNLKIEELTQILRGKSKQIKH